MPNNGEKREAEKSLGGLPASPTKKARPEAKAVTAPPVVAAAAVAIINAREHCANGHTYQREYDSGPRDNGCGYTNVCVFCRHRGFSC